MNRVHHWICSSGHWRRTIEGRVPWVVGDAQLGPDVLEVGPGPGLTTDLLRLKAKQLTVLELDPVLVQKLALRLRGTNVEVVKGDATTMPFPSDRFSGAVSFTMLHHVPSPELQDKLLHEVRRVLRPGGAFVGSDSLQGLLMRLIHIGDTLVPVDPETFGTRLEAAGFEVLGVQKNSGTFRFHARRPL